MKTPDELQAEIEQLQAQLNEHTRPLRTVGAPFRWAWSKMPSVTFSQGLNVFLLTLIACFVLGSGLTFNGCSLPFHPINPFGPTIDVFPNDGKSRLIVVYDKMDQNTLSAMYSEQVRLYVGANLDVGPDGAIEARVYGPDADLSKEHELWQKAFEKAKGKKLPYYALVGKLASSDGDVPASGPDMVNVAKRCCGGARLPMAARPPPADFVLTKANTEDVRDRKAGLRSRPEDWASPVTGEFDLPEMSDEQINAAIARKNADKSWLPDIRMYGANGKMIPSRDQNGKGYCWAHSSVSATLMVRAKNFQPYSDLSAYAVACIIKGYRDEGGWGQESLEFIASRGVPSSKFWPQRSMSQQNDRPETWADAANHKITRWMAVKTKRQLATCLCNNVPVVSDFNWWSHSVCTVQLKAWGTNGDQLKTTIWNSWGDGWSANGMGDLEGGKALPDDMVAPCSVTAAYAARKAPEVLYASAP